MVKLPNPVDYQVYTGGPLSTPQLYSYILHGGGVVKYGAGDHFQAQIPVSNGVQITGLPPLLATFELHRPLIPARWLTAVLDHARQAGTQHRMARPAEAMYHFHWDDDRWRVAIPEQLADPSRVGYSGGDAPSIVLDLHSHHEMDAFFSETDDADEQGLRIYGVIGKIYSRPELRLRVGVYGDWLELKPTEVFEHLGPFVAAKGI